MDKLYKVFKVDTCWQEYSCNYDYVGAESIEDLINHIKDIFPDTKRYVCRQDWMDEDDWNDECMFGKYKEGDTIYIPYFTESQYKELIDQNTNWPRIKEVEHMYTDIPYIRLDGFGYVE